MMSKATNVEATLIDLPGDGSKFDAIKAKPGAFYFYKDAEFDDAGIIFSCPCGCGTLGTLPVVKREGRPCWTMTGSKRCPTLNPSVGLSAWNQDKEADGFHWHGWLRAGVWVSV